MTWFDLRSFALGELGWTEERFTRSTLFQYNLAVSGYWRNWERNTAWLMREVVYTLIAGNGFIDAHNKPSNSRAIIKISDDEKAEEINKSKRKAPTAEELEATRQELLNLMNKK